MFSSKKQLESITITPTIQKSLEGFGVKVNVGTTVKIDSLILQRHREVVWQQFHHSPTTNDEEDDAIAISRAMYEQRQVSKRKQLARKIKGNKDMNSRLNRTNFLLTILIMLVLMLLLMVTQGKAQTNDIKLEVQNSGTRVKLFSAGIARLNCGSGLSCTYSSVNGRVNIDGASGSVISGDGTTNRLAMFTDTITIGNSPLLASSSDVVADRDVYARTFVTPTSPTETATLSAYDVGFYHSNYNVAATKASGLLGVWVDIGENSNKSMLGGYYNVETYSTSGTTASIIGLGGRVKHGTVNTVTTMRGLQYVADINKGTTTLADSLWTQLSISSGVSSDNITVTEGNILSGYVGLFRGGSGTITISTLRGLNFTGWSKTGTISITDFCAICADTTIDLGATNNHFIKSTSTSPSELSGNLNIKAQFQQNRNTQSTNGAITFNFNTGNIQQLTLTGNGTSTTLSNLKDGSEYTITIIQDATGSRTMTWGTSIKWVGGAAPTLTTTAAAKDVFKFYSDGSNLYEVSRALDVK